MVMTSTSASVDENLVTFIVKNLLSKDVIVTFGGRYRTLFNINVHFKWYIFRVKVPFNLRLDRLIDTTTYQSS